MQKLYNLNGYGESYPIAAVLVENRYLYFVTLYNNYLYKLDLETNSYSEILMPVKITKDWMFRNILYVDGKILFAPFRGTEFWAYDLKEEKFLCICEEVTKDSEYSFRNAIYKKDRWYLLDSSVNKIVVLDVNNMCLAEEITLPEHDDEGQIDVYVSMKWYKDYLLVFCNNRKKILQIDIASKEIEWIKTEHSICHAEVIEDSIYYSSTVSDLDGIYCLNVLTKQTKRIAKLTLLNNEKINNYRFWNTKKIGDVIYFLPNEYSLILCYDIKKDKVYYVKPFEDDHISKRKNNNWAVNEIIPYNEKLVVIPYDGSTITIIDNIGNIESSVTFLISKEAIFESAYDNETKDSIIESRNVKLTDFIEYVKATNDNAQERKRLLVGANIWDSVKER